MKLRVMNKVRVEPSNHDWITVEEQKSSPKVTFHKKPKQMTNKQPQRKTQESEVGRKCGINFC